MGIHGIDNLFGDDFPEHKNHDATDVPAALARETQDGAGFESEDDLPESDLDEEVNE